MAMAGATVLVTKAGAAVTTGATMEAVGMTAPATKPGETGLVPM